MPKFRRKPVEVDAIQLQGHTAIQMRDEERGLYEKAGEKGDWLVVFQDGTQDIVQAAEFERLFEPAAPAVQAPKLTPRVSQGTAQIVQQALNDSGLGQVVALSTGARGTPDRPLLGPEDEDYMELPNVSPGGQSFIPLPPPVIF